MVLFPSLFDGLARSVSIKKGKNSQKDVGKEAAEALAKDARKSELILSSSGIVKSNRSNNFASVCSKRGQKGINQDSLIVWEVCQFTLNIYRLTIIEVRKSLLMYRLLLLFEVAPYLTQLSLSPNLIRVHIKWCIGLSNWILVFRACFWFGRNLDAKRTLSFVGFLMGMVHGDMLFPKGLKNLFLLLCCVIGKKHLHWHRWTWISKLNWIEIISLIFGSSRIWRLMLPLIRNLSSIPTSMPFAVVLQP